MLLRLTTALLLFAVLPLSAHAATLSGRVVFDGTAPAPAALKIDKDKAVCGKDSPVDESLVVSDDGGLANVVIWVRTKKLKAPKGFKPASITLDNKNCRFEPHVLVVQSGEKLTVKNSDSVGHNSNFATFKNPGANVLIPANGEVKQKFSLEEPLPVKVTCNIHPWMTGYVLVRKTPFAAVTDKDGNFKIEGLPEGKSLEFVFWHEKSGYLKEVKVGGKSVPWKKGRVKKTLKGDLDLGTIEVAAKLFK